MVKDLLREDFEREHLLCSIYLREDEEEIKKEINTIIVENPKLEVKIEDEIKNVNQIKNNENGIFFF
jgi:phage terminase large subunit-like protein